MTQNNNWYVFTGAPSSGKSTLIAELAKLGYQVLKESGRFLIDQELASGKTLEEVQVDSPEFEQAWIKFQSAQESKLDKNDQIFFDRGILDALAYFKFYGWPIPATVQEICQTATYKKVFLCDLLEYDKDYARVETAATARQMQKLFGEVYREAGYEVIGIPHASIQARLSLVFEAIHT